MRWIREHKLISAIIAILLILVIVFAVSIAKGGKGNPITGAVNKGASVVSGGLSSVTESIKENVKGIFSYKSLQKQVNELQAENDQLKKELAETGLDREDLEQLKELSEALNFDYTKKEFDLVTADITSMDGSNWTNVFTIDRGSESGIETGDAVVNGMGLVGR